MSPRTALFRTPGGVVLLTIVLGTLVRLFAAATMGLGIDEAYGVANAREFQLSFFDHPPLSFWFATAVMKLTGSDAALLIRLPFIALFAITTFLLYRFGRDVFDAWSGAWAAVLFNLTPFFSIVTGSWQLPDGPLCFGVLASAVCLRPVLAPKDREHLVASEEWRCWLGAGFWLGVAMLSKYLAVLYAVGVVLYVATTPRQRRWLMHPAPYLGLLVSAVVFLPVIGWNVQHDWVSFAFQADRARFEELRPEHVFVSVGGQALYLLPWIWWPLVWEGAKALRIGRRSASTWLCVCLAVPPIVLMSVIPLWGAKGLPHWTAVGYIFLFPVLGLATTSRLNEQRTLVRRWLRFSIVSFPLIVIALSVHAGTGWGRAIMPGSIVDHDPTQDMLSWRPVEGLLSEHGLNGEGQVVIVGLHWIDGAKLGHALGARRPVTVFSASPHYFPFLATPDKFVGRDLVFVGPPHRLESVELQFREFFDGFERLGTVELQRQAGPEKTLEAVLARNLRKPYPWPYGPE